MFARRKDYYLVEGMGDKYNSGDVIPAGGRAVSVPEVIAGLSNKSQSKQKSRSVRWV